MGAVQVLSGTAVPETAVGVRVAEHQQWAVRALNRVDWNRNWGAECAPCVPARAVVVAISF